MIGLVSTVVTVDIPRRDRLFSGSICYRMRSCKSSSGVSSNAVEASKDSTVIAIYTGCHCGYSGDPRRACSCAPGAISRYQKRQSTGPKRNVTSRRFIKTVFQNRIGVASWRAMNATSLVPDIL